MRRIPLSALIGMVLTTAYFLAAIFAPLIAPYGMAELVGGVWEPMSARHLLGTDSIGRDLLCADDLRRPDHDLRRHRRDRAVVHHRINPWLYRRRAGRLGRPGAVALCRSDDGDPVADHGAGDPVGDAGDADHPDPGDRPAGRDPRLPPGPCGGGGYRGDGLCRGGASARRGPALDHLPRDPAKRHVAPGRRTGPALHLRGAVHLHPVVPRPRYPAAVWPTGAAS